MTRDTESDAEPVQVGEAESYVTAHTELALLVVIDDGDNTQQWVPRSVIHDDSEVFDDRDNTRGKLVVKRWWAARNGLC